MTDPLIGKTIGERFHLTAKIGEGGMGIVYVADDKAAGGRAAVKFLHKHLMSNADFVARFRQEAKSASRFRHESAVRVLAAGDSDDGVPYLVMEYVPGRSLKTVLREDGPLSVARACSIGIQILRALAEAHKNGIIHRDLKPENVKVETGPDGGDRVKVLDFGVAKFIGTEDLQEMTGAVKTKTGVVFGTPKYMAPEQILGEQVDGRSDIYSVGAILYEMLTGTPPFASDDIMGFVTKHLKEPVEPPSRRAPDRPLPAALEKTVLEMLDKNRVARPARAADIADALEPHLKAPRRAPAPAAGAAGESGKRLGALFYLAAGVLASAGIWLLARSSAAAGVPAAVGLAIGATAAFTLFPRVGEGAFWIRALLVAVCLAAGAAVAAFAAGAGFHLPVAFALGSLLVFVLYSAGWGRRTRLFAFLLGGVLAPVLAAALMPFPARKGFAASWSLTADGGSIAPALAMVAIGLSFGLAAFVAPTARTAAPQVRNG